MNLRERRRFLLHRFEHEEQQTVEGHVNNLFRELDISNDWSQWWLGIGARQGGVGTVTGPVTTPPTPNTVQWTPQTLVPGTGGLLDGMGQITLDTSVGAGGSIEPTQDPVTGLPDPRAKTPTRLRSISSVTLLRPFRQERVEADYAGSTTANGGAIISTRDSVSIGFGLEQVPDAAVRSELVRLGVARIRSVRAHSSAQGLRSRSRPEGGG